MGDKKRIAIFLATGFETTEALTTTDILRRASGVQVDLISVHPHKTVFSAHGVVVIADEIISTIWNKDKGKSYDLLVLPGGDIGTSNLISCEELKNMVVSFLDDPTKKVAAICAAPQIIGLLKKADNREIAVYPNRLNWLENSVTYHDRPLVISDNLITSPSMGSVFKFALSLVELMVGKKERIRIEDDLVILF